MLLFALIVPKNFKNGVCQLSQHSLIKVHLVYSLPWNQTTPLGYLAEICFQMLCGEAYLTFNGSVILLFISMCLYHQAFYKMFQYSMRKMNQPPDEGQQDTKGVLCNFIRFHISVKEWVFFTHSIQFRYDFLFAQNWRSANFLYTFRLVFIFQTVYLYNFQLVYCNCPTLQSNCNGSVYPQHDYIGMRCFSNWFGTSLCISYQKSLINWLWIWTNWDKKYFEIKNTVEPRISVKQCQFPHFIKKLYVNKRKLWDFEEIY